MTHLRCFRARAVLSHAGDWTPDGVVVVESGRVRAVLEARQAEAELAGGVEVEWTDLGEALLTPGLVNAHAHLELGALEGRLPRGGPMFSWVGAVLAALATLEPEDHEAGVARGAARLLETGTTTVGDIDSSGASARGLARTGIRGRVYREVLDARDPGRTSGAAARLQLDVDPGPAGLVLPGVSPHGPHTVSAALLDAAVARTRDEGSALSMHVAESVEEAEWLASGGGPFGAVLGAWTPGGALEALERSGALEVPLSLVHANHLSDAELGLAARAGLTLVHCPGTHAYFERDGRPLERWIRAGVGLALGTDSLASNEDLDLQRELQLAAQRHPALAARDLFEAATRGGARALGLAGQVGELTPGAHADLCAVEAPTGSREEALECLIRERPSVLGVWIGGVAR